MDNLKFNFEQWIHFDDESGRFKMTDHFEKVADTEPIIRYDYGRFNESDI